MLIICLKSYLRNKMYYPILIPTSSNTFTLLENYNYKEIIVPRGYETNGADVPRIFWSIIPPFKPKYLPAVVVHDYLCSLKQYEKANCCFEEMLYEIEESILTIAMVKSVKFYTKYIR